MATSHRPGSWTSELSVDRRSCKLLGYYCVSDFDMSPEALAPISWEILEKLQGPELALAAGECDAINIGIYRGGKDIRVWKVWFR